MKKKLLPSIRSTTDLARQLGLSRWTVSRALNGHDGINPQTAERVRAAARASNFEPNVFGVGLRSGKMNWVGVGLPDLVDYFLTDKLSRLQRSVQDLGMRVDFQILEQTPAGERLLIERFTAMRCAGIVLIASQLQPDDPALRRLAESGVRLVRIDPLRPGLPFDVSTDRSYAMETALNHFHQLGHRKIAIAGVDERSGYGQQRLEGIERACQKLGWEILSDLCFLLGDAEDDFQLGTLLGEKFLALPRGKFTAILTLNDRIALGMLQILKKNGYRIPRDVSLIGYDDSDFAPYIDPPLSTIDPGVDELITLATGLLVSNAEGLKRHTVKPHLIERGSTADVPDIHSTRD